MTPHPRALAGSVLATCLLLPAQHDATASAARPGPFIAPASQEAQKQIASFQLARGLVCDLVAAEPDLCNGVAFAIDGKGRFYVAETFRINDGVFDTRSYMQWKDRDLACLTVADRIAKYEQFIPDDIPKYTAFSERIRMLVDTDRNGTLDRSTVFADGFHDLADGIGAGVLPVGDDVFFTNIPKLWRLRDDDGDGVADERHVVHDGFGVHTSLIGHDLHGLIVGPDRRLYFSIGDRGFHVQQGDKVFAYPHEGAVLRCELDGSDLEVVHRGLRNPQELAFDQWGDLFTGDNNSDGGDRARFVPIIAGADSGWRIGFQWLSDRGAWNREQMWQPRHPGQPAWIMPPIVNIADGPSGLAFDPGVGLPERYRDCFFLCDFRGGSSYSGVHALRLHRKGAGFELASTEKPIWSVLATDVEFGPDGSLYVLDWVSGWNKTGKGRIYRVRAPQMANDPALRLGANLLASNLAERTPGQLRALLSHADRRVRQAAQFALVDLGASDELLEAATSAESRLARLHGIWGLGVLGRKQASALEPLLPLLDDGDGDVRAMTARVLGDARVTAARKKLQKLLSDPNSRVAKEAALALARLGDAAAGASEALLDLLRHNDDHDHVLRHAAVFALASAAPRQALLEAANDASAAVRLGVLLALSRRQDDEVARFLGDADPALRYEAARAIYQEPIGPAMPALAKLCHDDTPDTVAIDWRAINANRLLGEVENGEALVHLAGLANHPAETRIEAIEVLAEWSNPHGQDRVFGNWRPCQHAHAETVAACFAHAAPALLQDAAVAKATAVAAGRLQLLAVADALSELVANGARGDATRIAALDALDAMKAPQLARAIAGIDANAPVPLRKRAVELMSREAPENAVPMLATLLANASLAEKQAAFVALGDLPHASAADLLLEWLGKLQHGEVPAALQLDLLEAARKHPTPAIRSLLAEHDAAAANSGALGEYLVCREGGDPKRGREVFFDNEATRCTRCHTLQGTGGNAGPHLDGIGKKQTRDYLLEALITPSARIAEGFGSTTLDLHDGTMLQGFVTKDQDGAVTIVGLTGEATVVPWDRIAKRTANGTSAMPPMGGALSKPQLRDLIAFLADQDRP
ncbi:MAG TPA: PVC-type heme-binding CxxCH protein [Planctomycetota bacterium]|nr:PVC-type heme-binding CxxCH protein [Planctomycetota bacterium]